MREHHQRLDGGAKRRGVGAESEVSCDARLARLLLGGGSSQGDGAVKSREDRREHPRAELGALCSLAEEREKNEQQRVRELRSLRVRMSWFMKTTA